jgi:hypothetical protein
MASTCATRIARVPAAPVDNFEASNQDARTMEMVYRLPAPIMRWLGMKEVLVAAGTEQDGIAGVLWDVDSTGAVTRRDHDIIYRLYRHGEAGALRGRCFVSEPQRPYAVGERLMLETREGQRIFGTVESFREMRTGSISLILAIDP